MLSVTGIALNHTEELAMDEKFVTSKWLNQWYGIKPPQIETAFKVEQHWVIQAGGSIYFANQQIDDGQLLGAVKAEFGFAVATQQKILLLDAEQNLIDILPFSQPAQKAYGKSNALQIEFANNQYSQPNDDWTELQPIENISLKVLKPVENYPDSLQQQIDLITYSKGITLERLMLDLHSGRFFGSYGHWVVDGFAIIFLVLSLTGFVLYLKRSNKRPKLPK